MAAHDREAARFRLLPEFRGRHSIGAGGLDVFETHVAHFVERARHVLRELRAETVKLQTELAMKAVRLRARRVVGGNHRTKQHQTSDQGNNRLCFRHRYCSQLSIIRACREPALYNVRPSDWPDLESLSGLPNPAAARAVR